MAKYAFEIGAAAWGLRLNPLKEQFAICRDLGLTQLELQIANAEGDYLQIGAGEKEFAQVREWSREYGIGIRCAATGNDFSNDDYRDQVTKVKTAIMIAAGCGCEFLRIFAGFNSDSIMHGARLDNMLASLKECAEFAKLHKITLVVETHGGVNDLGNGAIMHVASITTRANTWQPILDTGCKMLYDPANLDAAGQADPIAFYHKFANSIAVIHLKDFKVVPGGWRPAACGEGGLDYPALMDAIHDFTGPVLLEYELPEDIIDGFRRCLKQLESCK